MTDREILLIDAECSYLHRQGDMTAYEWSDAIVDSIPRLCWLETDYGKNRDSEDNFVNGNREIGEWFSLIVAAELRHNYHD